MGRRYRSPGPTPTRQPVVHGDGAEVVGAVGLAQMALQTQGSLESDCVSSPASAPSSGAIREQEPSRFSPPGGFPHSPGF
jgi:hypothetical protein